MQEYILTRSLVLPPYQEEYERIVLEVFNPKSLTDKTLLDAKKNAYLKSLSTVLARLNVKAQILIEDLKVMHFTLSPEVETKLKEINLCTVGILFKKFESGD